MITHAVEYIRYFPVFPEIKRWGLGVTASGFTRISSGSPYPPTASHPKDHEFAWEHGRAIDGLQIVLITSGRGVMETRATGLRNVEPGMAFLLLPQTWHRFRPDPNTGWEESWIELQGPVVNNLIGAGTFPENSILRTREQAIGLHEILDSIHYQSRKWSGGFLPHSSGAGLQALAAFSAPFSTSPPSAIQCAVSAAEQYLTDHHTEQINIEELATRLGVAYSHFRRVFKKHTGLSPWQYVLNLRLTHARRLLASSSAKLEEVASLVGFSTGFHLSISFKQAYGQSPAKWRQSLAKHPDRSDSPRDT